MKVSASCTRLTHAPAMPFSKKTPDIGDLGAALERGCSGIFTFANASIIENLFELIDTFDLGKWNTDDTD